MFERAWTWISDAVMPESTGEARVREMLESDPLVPFTYDRDEDFTAPHVYTQAKGAVSDALETVGGGLQKYFLIAVGILLIAAIAYGGGLLFIQSRLR